MGRYAFFNTGLEYKFGFGIQESTDMEEFGGKLKILGDNDGEITWSVEDIPAIRVCIKTLEDCLGFEEFSVEKYEKSLKGTLNLKSDLYEILDMSDKESYTYILGFLIYHQLLYTSPLVVRFEY